MSDAESIRDLAKSTEARSQFFRLVLQTIAEPALGLPDEVFEFALSITPMINVDLLVTGDHGVLLAWREDSWGVGWHVPGGIVRVNEPIAHRIAEVARLELGTVVLAASEPTALSQFFAVRGHFISLLYRCDIAGRRPGPMASDPACPRPGELAWFEAQPLQVYPAHRDYVSRLAEFGATNVLTLAEPPTILG